MWDHFKLVLERIELQFSVLKTSPKTIIIPLCFHRNHVENWNKEKSTEEVEEPDLMPIFVKIFAFYLVTQLLLETSM